MYLIDLVLQEVNGLFNDPVVRCVQTVYELKFIKCKIDFNIKLMITNIPMAVPEGVPGVGLPPFVKIIR